MPRSLVIAGTNPATKQNDRSERRPTNRWTGATGSEFRIKRDPAKLLGSAVARSTQPLGALSASGKVVNTTKRNIRRILTFTFIMLIQASCTNQPPISLVLSISDSPNGKYRCVVTEQSPEQGMKSPFIYTFSIQDRTSGTDLEGQKLEVNLDSAQYDRNRLKFAWSIDQLIVSDSLDEQRDNKIGAAVLGTIGRSGNVNNSTTRRTNRWTRAAGACFAS
jgi:hypothetical protein